MNTTQKRILGRWLEALSIGVIGGGIVAFQITDWKFWYYLLAPIFLLILGTWLYENNPENK